MKVAAKLCVLRRKLALLNVSVFAMQRNYELLRLAHAKRSGTGRGSASLLLSLQLPRHSVSVPARQNEFARGSGRLTLSGLRPRCAQPRKLWPASGLPVLQRRLLQSLKLWSRRHRRRRRPLSRLSGLRHRMFLHRCDGL